MASTEPAQIGEKRPREDEATTEAPAAKQAAAETAPSGEPQDDAKRDELLKAVLRQVEFYFSDSNYPKDKFLRTKAAENDDWVPFSVLKTFNRLKQLTTDDEIIADALSLSQGLLEVSADRKSVKRALPLPEDLKTDSQSIYAKGFPRTMTQEEMEEYWRPLGNIRSVRLRRFPNSRDFKSWGVARDGVRQGSVFVEFGSPEEAQAFVQAGHKYKDTPLKLMMKLDYVKEKAAEYEKQKQKKQKAAPAAAGAGAGAAPAAKKAKTETAATEGGAAKEGEAKADDEKAEAATPFTPKEGTIVRFEGVGPEATRELLKDVFGPFGSIEFVEFQKGEESGYVRFTDAVAAAAVAKLSEGEGTDIGGAKPKLRVLEGEENTQYWAKLQEIAKNRSNANRGGKRGGRGGRGGRGRGRGRGGKK